MKDNLISCGNGMTTGGGTITFLGTGTSSGVPQIGCRCNVCRSADFRDRRMRCSSLVEAGGMRILIDCGPDFYFQMKDLPFSRVDGVLVTHEHYDHVGGLDDLRPFCIYGTINVYANELTSRHIRERIPYCFKEHPYRGVPNLKLVTVAPHETFSIGNVSITPLRVMHGKLEILGYRIGDMAYITDMTSADTSELQYISGVKLLVVNALRKTPHPTHQTVEQAVAFARAVGNQPTYFIHMSHEVGLHSVIEQALPENMHFAYDGLKLTF